MKMKQYLFLSLLVAGTLFACDTNPEYKIGSPAESEAAKSEASKGVAEGKAQELSDEEGEEAAAEAERVRIRALGGDAGFGPDGPVLSGGSCSLASTPPTSAYAMMLVFGLAFVRRTTRRAA